MAKKRSSRVDINISKKEAEAYLKKQFKAKWKTFLKAEQLKFDSPSIRMIRQLDGQDTILFVDRGIGAYIRIHITDKKFYKELCKKFPELVVK